MSANNPPPVSLGKPSLRHRLEAYYSLVAPEAIADASEWKRKFDIIHSKFGGTVEGETKLSQKLAKKYGNQVMLLVAPPHRSMRGGQHPDASLALEMKHDEKHYELNASQRGSKVLDFTSDQFDASYALVAPEREVIDANPSIYSDATTRQIQQLDNISKFRSLLPMCDPQMIEPKTRNTSNATLAISSNASDAEKRKVPMLLAMSAKYENKKSGPLSLLYSIVANRQRARVMVRYVDCIRGTLTGYVLAFDKHFNMIMRDVDEVYSGRITQDSKAVEAVGGAQTSTQTSIVTVCAPPKAKLEARRRMCYPPDGSGGPGPAVKQRYFHQLMVRGDNVVMIWRAESERSAHPLTKRSPTKSLYVDVASSESKVGTPGSLFYALQRWESQNSCRRK
jgi:small nuclear ribonucleoprotein (snRNP)-like protein